eukprot:gene4725-5899_t
MVMIKKENINYNSNAWSSKSKSKSIRNFLPQQQQPQLQPQQQNENCIESSSYFLDQCQPQPSQINKNKKFGGDSFQTPKENDYKVKLSLRDWNHLVSEYENNSNQVKYSIERAEYKGTAEEYTVELECNFTIVTFVENQCIPILPISVAIKNYTIGFTRENQDGDQRMLGVDNNEGDDEQGCIGIYEDTNSLLAQAVGSYHVKVNILVNYLSSKQNGFDIASPSATFNHITFSVPKKVHMSIHPAFDSSNLEKIEKDANGNTVSTISTSFSPTQIIKVQWTDYDDEDKYGQSSSSSSPPSIDKLDTSTTTPGGATNTNSTKTVTKVTAEQLSLCSVGEGVIMIRNQYKFEVQSGSVSSFDIIVGSGLKVLTVDGLNIKKWDYHPTDNNNESIVKVQLNYSVEDSYQLVLISEIEMESTSGNVRIPSVRCRGNEISREKGYLVVESTANVEVEHQSREGLTLVDKTELPEDLVASSSGPLLLSYKFLKPSYLLNFKVLKHQDLSVLVAFCEMADFIATCSSEGNLLYKLRFKMKNTQQQYIRVSIPHNHEIWSTVVGNNAVKPAKDDQGTLMIPLQKSSGEKGSQKTFDVELVYKHMDGIAIGENGGNLSLVFPQIDIPIGVLLVTLYLPVEYTYGKFHGNVKEVTYFTKSFYPSNNPTSTTTKAKPAYGYKKHHNIELAQAYDDDEDDLDSGLEQIQHSNPIPSGQALGGTAGLKSLQINIPTVGTQIKFEQLLVINTPVNVNCQYYPTRKYCNLM